MYSPEQVAHACTAPLENVSEIWPVVLAALDWQGINDSRTRVAMAATIAVETSITVNGRNMTFLPITEIDGQYARYAPWYGRGLIQCTWESNYAAYGPRLSPPQNLLANPDILLQPVPSAQMAALYFKDRGIPAMAASGGWQAVREAVNGGLNGWNVFYPCVVALLNMPESDWSPTPPHQPVTTVAVRDQLRQKPVDKPPDALDAHHQSVVLEVGTVVHFCPDPAPGANHGKTTTPNWAHLQVGSGPIHGWFKRASLQTK